eukprot:TRINITY_DN4278_c1_g1_i5.p1 TRINITY_DN4278_c1_g1~~TRINITY_DN4278_c1_g1_i5.p1  ORF type:complete len:371 (+),score=-25.79 TRINITY_DN4278_c1_g1_i5:124-1236(+)
MYMREMSKPNIFCSHHQKHPSQPPQKILQQSLRFDVSNGSKNPLVKYYSDQQRQSPILRIEILLIKIMLWQKTIVILKFYCTLSPKLICQCIIHASQINQFYVQTQLHYFQLVKISILKNYIYFYFIIQTQNPTNPNFQNNLIQKNVKRKNIAAIQLFGITKNNVQSLVQQKKCNNTTKSLMENFMCNFFQRYNINIQSTQIFILSKCESTKFFMNAFIKLLVVLKNLKTPKNGSKQTLCKSKKNQTMSNQKNQLQPYDKKQNTLLCLKLIKNRTCIIHNIQHNQDVKIKKIKKHLSHCLQQNQKNSASYLIYYRVKKNAYFKQNFSRNLPPKNFQQMYVMINKEQIVSINTYMYIFDIIPFKQIVAIIL